MKQHLNNLNLKFLEVNNKTIPDIKTTIRTIGDSCNAKTKAKKLLYNINKVLSVIKKKTEHLSKPKVIISIGRTFGTGTIKEVYIAGKNTFYDELISLAGGVNAYKDSSSAYPMLSAEGLIQLNPEIIIDFATDINLSNDVILKDWESIKSIDAIKNKRIKIFRNDYIVIPGPRFTLTLKDLANTIHPEINWDELNNYK
jgi:iron complex transport system substrate-binding protein